MSMYTPQKQAPNHPGGPSFSPLYESARSRGLPETPTWMTSDTGVPAWADVVVDFRVPQDRYSLPESLGDPEVVWESRAPGWGLSGWSVLPETNPNHITDVDQDGVETVAPVDAYSVARFTDPEGFRFAFVVSHDHPGVTKVEFSPGRLAHLMPSMRNLFLEYRNSAHPRRGANLTNEEYEARVLEWRTNSAALLSLEGFTNATATYSLETLRDAVADPATWFGTTDTGVDWQDLTLGGHYRPIVPARALLGWAAGGATSFAPVAHWVAGGMDAAEVAHWVEMTSPPEPTEPDTETVATPTTPAGEDDEDTPEPWTDADIIAWFGTFGGGRRRRTKSLQFRNAGLTTEQAQRWGDILSGGSKRVKATVHLFERAGWNPCDAVNVRTALNGGSPYYGGGTLEEAAQWVFVHPDHAVAYIAAGYSHPEAAGFERNGESVSLEALNMMAALLPQPEPDPFF